MIAVGALTCGCSGAPALAVAGAYFPAWLACALVAVGVAIVARIVFVASGLASRLPLQLFVCLSVGFFAGALVWLAWAGR
jgi:hypothetical protein